MTAREVVPFVLSTSVAATVFGFGLVTPVEELLYVVRRPALLVRSALAMLVVMPLVAVVCVRSFELARPVKIALVALAISPVPPMLPRRDRAASGRFSYGVALLATIALASIATVPLSVHALERVFGLSLGVAPSAIALVVTKVTLAPLVLGATLRAFAPDAAARWAARVTRGAGVLFVAAVIPMLAILLPGAWKLVGEGGVLALLGFVAIGLLVGHVLGGPERDHATVLALSTACRHPAVAWVVTSTNFPEERFGAVFALYVLVGLLVTLPYVAWQRRRATTPRP